MIVEGYFCFTLIRFRPSEFAALGIPVGAAVVCGLLQVLINRFVGPYLGNILTLVITLAVSACVYWVLLFLSGNVSEQELSLSSFGSWIYKVGHSLHMV